MGTSIAPSPAQYLKSLGLELHVQAERIRQLIGAAHFLTDGHHKEYLLTSVLQRHLPIGTIAGRGFVVNEDSPTDVSKEQDVLVVDTFAQGPLFNQGNVTVAFAKTVFASASVKTKPSKAMLIDAIAGLASIPVSDGSRVWRGLYFFDGGDLPEEPKRLTDWLGEAGEGQRPALDLVCVGSDLAYKIDAPFGSGWRVRAYDCAGVAPGLFIGVILAHIAAARDAESPFDRYIEHVPFGQISAAQRDFA